MKRLLIKLVKFYQLSISPLKAPWCNPFSKGVYDPVPEKKEKHKHIEE